MVFHDFFICVNYSVIANCYDISFLFLAIENSGIETLTDLKGDIQIGVIEFDKPFLNKIFNSCL